MTRYPLDASPRHAEDANAGLQPVPPRADQEGRVELLGLLAILWRFRAVVIGVPALMGLAATGFMIVCKTLPPAVSPLPDVYLASAAILIDDQQQSALELQALLGSENQSALLAQTLGVGSETGVGALVVEMLDSKSTIDVVVAEFDLIGRYRIRAHERAASRREFRRRARFMYDPATDIVTVAFQDYEPIFAMNVTNRLVDILGQRVAGLDHLGQAQDYELTAHRQREIARQITLLEERIKEFQLRYGILTIDTLALEQSQRMAVVRGQITQKEVEVRTYAALTRVDGDPLLAKLRTEREILVRLLEEMESGYAEFEPAMPSQDELPDLVLEFSRLRRELAVLDEIYSALTLRYELSRIEVGTSQPVFQVLESADEPDLKHGPRWSIIVVGSVLCTFIAAVAAVFLVAALRKAMADPKVRQRFRRPE